MVSWSKSAASACLECVTVKKCQFQHGWNFGTCHGQNRQLQLVRNVSWSKLSVAAWLECVMVKIISFSMAGMCQDQNRQFQGSFPPYAKLKWFPNFVKNRFRILLNEVVTQFLSKNS
jgi:hypothetical protein